MARGDGKTTRQIQKAIARAREGVPVLYITRGPPSYYMGLAHHLAPDGVMASARREMLIPHGASIRFVEDANIRAEQVMGWRGVAAVDHAANPYRSGWLLLEHPNIEIDGSVPDPTDSSRDGHTEGDADG